VSIIFVFEKELKKFQAHMYRLPNNGEIVPIIFTKIAQKMKFKGIKDDAGIDLQKNLKNEYDEDVLKSKISKQIEANFEDDGFEIIVKEKSCTNNNNDNDNNKNISTAIIQDKDDDDDDEFENITNLSEISEYTDNSK
jgi:hypothetical protein